MKKRFLIILPAGLILTTGGPALNEKKDFYII